MPHPRRVFVVAARVGILLLLALASPALLRAQFQQPTAEELKMTSDPKAPGAAAVYLNIEEVANDSLHYRSYYARIKVLTEKGKDLASVSIPFLHGSEKVSGIKARTIHSDGTIIPLEGKPGDLLSYKATTAEHDTLQVNNKVFTLPSVEVGSILEYQYQLDYGDCGADYSACQFLPPDWEIQRPYFVHKAHYFFQPAYADRVPIVWVSRLPNGVKVQDSVTGHYSVDVTDVPPSPDEEWRPPSRSFIYRVIFYYKPAYESTALEYWTTAGKDWSKDVNHFAEHSNAIKDAVAGLVSPSDSDLDKAKKLYKAVQTLDNTDYSRKKTESEMKQLKLKEAKHAQDTWAQKSGDSEDIAMLYLAMIRAAGLTAYAEKIVDRKLGVFDMAYLSLDQLDNTLVVLSTAGKEIELDPGEKMCPFGTVNWRHSSAGGLSQSVKGVNVGTSASQQYTDNKTLRLGDVTLDGNGALTGVFRFDFTGQEALYWRQQAVINDEDEVKKQFDTWLESIFPEGVEAHIDHFNGLADPDQKLIASIKAQGSFGAATSKRLMLPAFIFETRGAQPFVAQEKRSQLVDMHYGEIVTDQVTYHLPDGFTVEGAPQDAQVSWPQHANLMIKTVSAPGKVTIARSLARAFTFAKPEEYNDLRGFYQKVAAADQAQLVLTKTASAGKGN
ncbi:MAG: DUF3857 domain-containing protein [Terracidiphilus sp.]